MTHNPMSTRKYLIFSYMHMYMHTHVHISIYRGAYMGNHAYSLVIGRKSTETMHIHLLSDGNQRGVLKILKILKRGRLGLS